MGLVRLGRAYADALGPVPGRLYTGEPGFLYSAASTVNTPNRTRFQRRTTRVMPISQVSFRVGVSSGNICVAAYAHDSATNHPGARLATTGSIACPASGDATVSLGATVSPEWLSFSCDNVTATFLQRGTSDLISILGVGILSYRDVFLAPDPAAPTDFIVGRQMLLVGLP